MVSESNVINTLIKLQGSGIAQSTLRHVSYKLRFLAKYVNIDDSEAVNRFIAGMNTANSYKNTIVKAYSYYAKLNSVSWVKPRFRYERKAIKIPTEDNVNSIIEGSSKKYAVIFGLLRECGMMPYELSKVSLKDIDLEKGILNVQGFKGHASRSFRLKTDTLAKLKWYINHYGDRPRLFPNAEWIERAWRNYRNRIAKQLQNPNIRNIRLYDLRHAFATHFYAKYRDPIMLMHMMGHKKLQTVMVYTQLLGYQNDEWTSATATDVKTACSLVEQGFQFVCDIDNVKIFRKPK